MVMPGTPGTLDITMEEDYSITSPQYFSSWLSSSCRNPTILIFLPSRSFASNTLLTSPSSTMQEDYRALHHHSTSPVGFVIGETLATTPCVMALSADVVILTVLKLNSSTSFQFAAIVVA